MYTSLGKLALSGLLLPPLVGRVALYSGITGRDLLTLAMAAATTGASSCHYSNQELREKVAALDLDSKLQCYKALISDIELNNADRESLALRVAVAGVKELLNEVVNLLDSLDYSLGLEEPSRISVTADFLSFKTHRRQTPGKNALTPLSAKNVERLCVYSALLKSRFDFMIELLQLESEKRSRQALFGKEVFNTYL